MTRTHDDGRERSFMSADDLEAIAREGELAATRLAEAFEDAGETISSALGAAADAGASRFNDMTESILQDLARIALERLVVEPLMGWTDQLGANFAQSIGDVIGQRASGGPVLAGASYLVGEQGPEVFVPGAGGAVTPAAASQVVHVTINASGDAGRAVRQSERQISAAIARAAAAGGRLL